MKKKNSIIGWAMVFAVLAFLLLILDFLALHDIKQDYVSPNVLSDFNINLSTLLPEWTATKAEWIAVQISLFVKASLLVVIIIGLVKAVKSMKV
ncbi:MAG: hypothetical protein HN352_02195 [Bacteroidetes bacterium]|jgi:hypothetical protein|nr:hypothetical protein [Bacteroidota bacterium]MBT3750832.1 hypothetical protein [Bacteroidota bacterium]MBT4402094.1 hypothetical protein [Bacteroidota bacterium]MBT4412040.1 hypothetical protein [Bacteroidota bacterium]MBT5425436.1 hypothetical protein [Bacteroidota bacterium]